MLIYDTQIGQSSGSVNVHPISVGFKARLFIQFDCVVKHNEHISYAMQWLTRILLIIKVAVKPVLLSPTHCSYIDEMEFMKTI